MPFRLEVSALKPALSLLLLFALCLTLCGCAAAQPTDAAPVSAPPQSGAPAATEVLEPDPALLALLAEIRDRMHIGTAGSSLRAAALAAELLDWGAESALSPAAIHLSLDAYMGGLDEAARAEFLQQLAAVDYSCTVLAAGGEQAEALLDDAGCRPRSFPWPQQAADQVGVLMNAAGLRY